MEFLEQNIEALIFSAEKPIPLLEIMECLSKLTDAEINQDQVLTSIEKIKAKFENPQFSFQLGMSGGGYIFLSKPAFHEVISVYMGRKARRKLSGSALETLAIIAYKQPVTKADVEAIRGVNSDYTISKLLEKELINITGRADLPGRPLLYITGDSFMDYFGINSVDDLPKISDLKPLEENEIGDKLD